MLLMTLGKKPKLYIQGGGGGGGAGGGDFVHGNSVFFSSDKYNSDDEMNAIIGNVHSRVHLHNDSTCFILNDLRTSKFAKP